MSLLYQPARVKTYFFTVIFSKNTPKKQSDESVGNMQVMFLSSWYLKSMM